MWARERCRISPPRFLAECCKRQLNQGSFVSLYFRLFTFSDLYCVCLSVFSCTVLFVSISQVIGCEDRLRNDLYCVEWGVKLCSNQRSELGLPNVYAILFMLLAQYAKQGLWNSRAPVCPIGRQQQSGLLLSALQTRRAAGAGTQQKMQPASR